MEVKSIQLKLKKHVSETDTGGLLFTDSATTKKEDYMQVFRFYHLKDVTYSFSALSGPTLPQFGQA